MAVMKRLCQKFNTGSVYKLVDNSGVSLPIDDVPLDAWASPCRHSMLKLPLRDIGVLTDDRVLLAVRKADASLGADLW